MINLEEALGDILDDYSDEVKESLKKTARKNANKAAKELKSTSPERRPRYKTQWRVKQEKTASNRVVYTVHNKKDYRLTHLLEHGHVLRNGGRSKATPHIAPVEEKYSEKYLKDTVSEIKKIK